MNRDLLKQEKQEGTISSNIDPMDRLFDSLGLGSMSKWFKPMSFSTLMKEANKILARYEALNRKYESKKEAYQSRSKLIPKNATIRKEFVKCKKPNCYRQLHGPYYYAYWKDPDTEKLKKRYIGSHYSP